MSKIGKKIVNIPDNVKVEIKNQEVFVDGPKGKLSLVVDPILKVLRQEKIIEVKIAKETKRTKEMLGLTRSLIANLIQGVTEGFSKTLVLHGTGYRAQLEGENLSLSLGFSHLIKVVPPAGIKFTLKGNKIIVSGADKYLVGQTSANIRAKKKPEVYKGKGIRWENEVVKLKPGKAAKLGEAGK